MVYKPPPPPPGEKPAPTPQHLISLLDLQTRLDKSLKARTAQVLGKQNTKLKEFVQDSKDHHDLNSFVAFAERSKLDTESTVYKGTHYEYTVMEAMRSFGFQLERTGKAGDKGIDLLGHWDLTGKPHQMKALVQCKACRATPAAVREVEGSHAGAPFEWRGDNVLGLIASSSPLTKGAVEGVQRSPSPLGALHIDEQGLIRQFVWNVVAAERGLAGLGVTTKYLDLPSRSKTRSKVPGADTQTIKGVTLTWNGKPFAPKTPEMLEAKN